LILHIVDVGKAANQAIFDGLQTLWQIEMLVKNRHPSGLLEPDYRLPYTTPPFSAALPYSNFFLYVITHHVIAQEPWKSNTPKSKNLLKSPHAAYSFILYSLYCRQGNFLKHFWLVQKYVATTFKKSALKGILTD